MTTQEYLNHTTWLAIRDALIGLIPIWALGVYFFAQLLNEENP